MSGAFGFTCGVEWLAPEKLNVHSSRGLAWDNEENIVPELARLNRLLTDHPCFFDNATLTRLSSEDDYVYALSRVSGEAIDRVHRGRKHSLTRREQQDYVRAWRRAG